MMLFNHVRTIGQAVWLFLLYQNNVKCSADQSWAPVFDSRPLRDGDAAEVLKVPVHTAIRWRRRLERAGVVRTMLCRGGGFKVWIPHPDWPSVQLPKRTRESGGWPAMQTEVVQ